MKISLVLGIKTKKKNQMFLAQTLAASIILTKTSENFNVQIILLRKEKKVNMDILKEREQNRLEHALL